MPTHQNPTPTLLLPSRRKQIIDSIMRDLASSGTLGKLRNNQLRERIETLSDSTLAIVESTAAWSRQRANPIPSFIDIAIMFTNESLTREALFFRPLIDADDADPVLVLGAVTGLHWIDRFRRYERLEYLTGHDLETAVAFINITIALHEHTEREQLDPTPRNNVAGAVLIDQDLHEIIATSPNKADKIIQFIIERKSADPGALRDYLNNETVLRDGTL
jgi:hypothetical protein